MRRCYLWVELSVCAWVVVFCDYLKREREKNRFVYKTSQNRVLRIMNMK